MTHVAKNVSVWIKVRISVRIRDRVWVGGMFQFMVRVIDLWTGHSSLVIYYLGLPVPGDLSPL